MPYVIKNFDASLSTMQARCLLTAVLPRAALACRDADGRCFTLLHPDRPLVPYGLIVPWDELHMSPGQAVTLAEGCLTIGTQEFSLAGDGVALTISPAPFMPDAFVAQLGQLAATRRLLPVLAERWDILLTALVRSAEDLTPAMRQLSGLGPGSTPTGDDLLVGGAAMVHRLAFSGAIADGLRTRYLSALDRLPLQGTTPVAREMIYHAVRGRFMAPLRDLVSNLGTISDITPATHELTKVGAQTGQDLLTGATTLARRIFSITPGPFFS